MNKTKKIILGILVVAGIIFGISKIDSQKAVAVQPIKIGVVAPLTGGAGFIGESFRNASLMSLEDYGPTKYKYELIFEDDQLNPKMSATAANKLINIDKVNAIISVTAGTGNVIAPLAEQNKVIHFGVANDANIAKGDYNFLHTIPPSESGRVFVNELQKRGIKKLAIFELKQEGAIALRKGLDENLEGTDIEIVFDEKFNSGDKDFRSAIAMAKQTKPDIYMLMFFSPELEILAKQIKELGVDTPLTSIQGFDLTQEKSLLEGYWYVSFPEPTNGFIDGFKEKYRNNPAVGATSAYDLVKLIIQSVEKIKIKEKLDNTDLLTAINSLGEFRGILGKTIINKEGLVIFEPVVKTIKDGKTVMLEE